MDLMTTLRVQWDRIAAAGAALLGAVVLLVGWLGVSGEGLPSKQLPYIISGGIGGVFLLGVAAVLWLSADLRDEWRVLEEIRVALVQQQAEHLSGGRAYDVPVEAGRLPAREVAGIRARRVRAAADEPAT